MKIQKNIGFFKLPSSLKSSETSKKLQKSENVDFFMIKACRRLLYLPEKLFLQKMKKWLYEYNTHLKPVIVHKKAQINGFLLPIK